MSDRHSVIVQATSGGNQYSVLEAPPDGSGDDTVVATCGIGTTARNNAIRISDALNASEVN